MMTSLRISLSFVAFIAHTIVLFAQDTDTADSIRLEIFKEKNFYLQETRHAMANNPDSLLYFAEKYADKIRELDFYNEFVLWGYGTFVPLPTTFYYNHYKKLMEEQGKAVDPEEVFHKNLIQNINNYYRSFRLLAESN